VLVVDDNAVVLEIRGDSGAIYSFSTRHLAALANAWVAERDAEIAERTAESPGQQFLVPLGAGVPTIRTHARSSGTLRAGLPQ
jgi:hypothetical protein